MAKGKVTDKKSYKTRSNTHKQKLSEDNGVYTIGNKAVHEKKEAPPTSIERMHLVRKGVTKKYLIRVKKQTNLDYQKLADVLSVTRATLINKKDEDKFNPSLSERIVGLAALYDFGYEVFEDREKFKVWMFTPNHALGGEMPYDLINNQFGREEVKNVLGRIEYGIYS